MDLGGMIVGEAFRAVLWMCSIGTQVAVAIWKAMKGRKKNWPPEG